MANSSDVESPVSLPATNARTWFRLLGLLFVGAATREFAATKVHIDAAPESIWHEVLFYEDVPGKPPLLLALMLSPIGTKGDKSEVGACIECRYKQGSLFKRITAVDMPYSIRFDVIEQCLGIETCAIARNGSYAIRRAAAGSEIVLTTNYTAFLHPRWLWRPVERLALHQLHSHILDGMRKMVAAEDRSARIVTVAYTCREEET
jgi:hypothetical protein